MKVIVTYHPERENGLDEFSPSLDLDKMYTATPVDADGRDVNILSPDLMYFLLHDEKGIRWYVHKKTVEIVRREELKEELLKMKNDL